MRYIILAWLSLACSIAVGQIEGPSVIEPYKLTTATVKSNIPPGAVLSGGWQVGPGLDFAPTGENAIIWTGNPGKHVQSFAGYWVLVGPEITVKDINGVEQKFKPYLGSGYVNESREVEVKGSDPPMPPPGTSWGLILEETGDSSPAWARLRVNLRKTYQSSDKHLLILDQSNLPLSLEKLAQTVRAANLPLPVLALVGEDGEVVKVMECPKTVEGVQKEVGK